jgi:hypothetical protein
MDSRPMAISSQKFGLWWTITGGSRLSYCESARAIEYDRPIDWRGFT